jgi:osmoprotectant transport system permease protein
MTWKIVFEHLYLVAVSAAFTTALGLILGIACYFYPRIRVAVLWAVDLLQTIPVLALLGFILLLLGGSEITVIVGLVLYSLLPVVRNTYTGLISIDPAIKEVAVGMGMTRMQRLLWVELPLSFPMIFTGVRIAVVTAIGIAVFATTVGGGGLGYIIYRGIYIQNTRLILQGALALMAMAVIFDVGMMRIEKIISRKYTSKTRRPT